MQCLIREYTYTCIVPENISIYTPKLFWKLGSEQRINRCMVPLESRQLDTENGSMLRSMLDLQILFWCSRGNRGLLCQLLLQIGPRYWSVRLLERNDWSKYSCSVTKKQHPDLKMYSLHMVISEKNLHLTTTVTKLGLYVYWLRYLLTEWHAAKVRGVFKR